MADVTLFEPHFHGGLNVGGDKGTPTLESKTERDAGRNGGLGRLAAVIAVLVVLGALVAIKRRRGEPPEDLLDAD